jgi:hypothetical protein
MKMAGAEGTGSRYTSTLLLFLHLLLAALVNRLLLPAFRSLEAPYSSYPYHAYAIISDHTHLSRVPCTGAHVKAWQRADRRCPGVERGGKKAAVHGMDVEARASKTCRLVRSSQSTHEVLLLLCLTRPTQH